MAAYFSPLDQLTIDSPVIGHHRILGEQGQGTLTARLSHALPERRIPGEAEDLLGHPGVIADRHEEPGLPIRHHLRYTADLGGDNGQARGHRFGDHEGTALGVGGEQSEIGGSEEASHIGT